jgi:flagellar basal-body rod protein FlgF
MDKMAILAASGLRSRLESLDMLANNLANANTSGFKSDQEMYGAYAGEAQEGQISTLPDVKGKWTNFAQGTLETTGNFSDLAISGEGFLAMKGPNGLLYTRDGHLRLDSKGGLTNSDGYPVVDEGGQPIRLTPNRPFEVDRNGAVRQDGTSSARIAVYTFPSAPALQKMGNSYFQANDAAGKPEISTEAEIHQGKIEASNVAAAESAVRLVTIMRQSEFLQRAITLTSDMGKRTVEEIGRIGN